MQGALWVYEALLSKGIVKAREVLYKSPAIRQALANIKSAAPVQVCPHAMWSIRAKLQGKLAMGNVSCCVFTQDGIGCRHARMRRTLPRSPGAGAGSGTW